MPLNEHKTINVELTIHVDGHRLRWERDVPVTGARYHGRDPREAGYSTDHTLETAIRTAVKLAVMDLEQEAMRDVARLYPTHSDKIQEASR